MLIEATTKRHVLQITWQGVYGVVEREAEVEEEEVGGEEGNRLVEVMAEGEVAEVMREGVNRLIERVSKREVAEGGREVVC